MGEPYAVDDAAHGTACAVCGTTEARPWRVAPDNLLGGSERFAAVRCVRCGLVRLQPRPSFEAMSRHYTPTTYARAEGDAETEGLGQRLDEFFRQQADRATEVHRQTPGSLLDVGCGDGRFLAAMAERGWRTEGIETEPAAASLARHRTGSTVHETPLEDARLPDAAFDMVSLLHVLEHVPDPRVTLSVARRVLTPGGTLLLALPNVGCLEANLFGSDWYPLDLPRHYWGFTPHTLVRLVEECGFTIRSLRYFPFLYAPQSVRYALRRGTGADNTTEVPTQPAARAEAGGLRTRLFLSLLGLSGRLGRSIPGEVMELAAVRSAS
jgi:SAM-dependent methyltransferase